MIDGVQDLLGDEGFRTGLRFGLPAVLAAILVTVAVLAIGRERRVLPLAGIAFVAAGVLALDDTFTVDREVVVALAVLAIGGSVAGDLLGRRVPPPVWLAAAVPGAVLFARSTDVAEPSWAYAVILATTLLGGLLMADADRELAPTGLPPLMLAFTVLGAYVTVPETEHVILLVGAALPLVVLGRPWPLASLGVGGSFAATALVTWIVVVDGSFRTSSVVGGIASLGMFAIEPVVRRLLGRDRTRHVVGVALLHVFVVGACSRVAGLRSSTALALVLAAVVYVAAGVALALLAGRGGRGMGEPTARATDPRGTSAFGHSA